MKKILVAILASFILLAASAVPTYAWHNFFFSAIHNQPILASNFLESKSVVHLTFIRVQQIDNISYKITYSNNGVSEGVSGVINNPDNKKVLVKNIFLGTCSQNICIKHSDAEDIKLEATYTFRNGSTTTKSYNVK